MCELLITNSAKKNRKRTINTIKKVQIANFIVLAYDFNRKLYDSHWHSHSHLKVLLIRYCAKTITHNRSNETKKNLFTHVRVQSYLENFCFSHVRIAYIPFDLEFWVLNLHCTVKWMIVKAVKAITSVIAMHCGTWLIEN